MSGLPASGKTTTAMRLHAQLGGVLIRSCDIYQGLGIVLPDWVKRTAGFTTNVLNYDRVRDHAYAKMARRTDLSLANGSPLTIIDAVHGERAKRQRLYEISATRGATPILIVCMCPDFSEVQRRFHAREGREAEPEREASDLSVFHDIQRRWESPLKDELPGGGRLDAHAHRGGSDCGDLISDPLALRSVALVVRNDREADTEASSSALQALKPPGAGCRAVDSALPPEGRRRSTFGQNPTGHLLPFCTHITTKGDETRTNIEKHEATSNCLSGSSFWCK